MQPNPTEHPRAVDTPLARREPIGGNSFGGTIAAVLAAFLLVVALGGVAAGVIGGRNDLAPTAAQSPAAVTPATTKSVQPADPVSPQPAPEAGTTPQQPSPTVPAPTTTP